MAVVWVIALKSACAIERQKYWDWNSNSVVRLGRGVNFQLGQMSEMIVNAASECCAPESRARQAVNECISISSHSGEKAKQSSGENDYHNVEFHSGREPYHRKWYPELLLDPTV